MAASDNMKREKNQRGLQHWQVMAIWLMMYDAIAVNAAYFAALWLRFDFRFSMIPSEYRMAWLKFAPIYAVVCVAVFWLFRLYRSLWEFASFDELIKVIQGTAITVVFHGVGIILLFHRMPISYYFVGAIFQFGVAVRF